MSNDRPIDKLRNAAISLEVGNGDDSETISMIPLSDGLLVVRTNDIYKVILADTTDPNRTNIKIQNAQQKVCDYGANDWIVGLVLLTAERLIKSPPYFKKDFNCIKALEISFKCTHELLAMRRIAMHLQKTIEDAMDNFEPNTGTLRIPHTSNLTADMRAYFEKSKQLSILWFELIKLFFPAIHNGQLTSLLKHIETEQNDNQLFINLLKECIDNFNFMKCGRDAAIHPRADQELRIKDFTLLPDGKLQTPSFIIVSPHIPDDSWDILSFLDGMTRSLVEYTEHLIAFLSCYSPLASHESFPRKLGSLSPERIRHHVRMTYTINLDGQECVLG